MKTVRWGFVLVLLFSVSDSALGQPGLSVEASGGESFTSVNPGTLSNWGNGWTVGGGIAYRFTSTMGINFSLAYDRYPYKGDHVELVLPAIAGLKYSVSGKPSTAEEAYIGFRFMSPSAFVSPFISLNAGVRNLSVGRIDVAEWFDPTPQDVSHSTYSGTGMSRIDFFAAVGFGLQVPVGSAVAVMIEGKYSEVFSPEETFMPLVARIQFDL